MKKILVLTKSSKGYFSELKKQGKKRLIDVHCCLYSEVSATFQKNRTSIKVGRSDLNSFDLIYFRGVSTSTTEIEIMIAKYCHFWKIPVIDKVHSLDGNWIDGKALQYTVLGLNNFPIIDSMYVTKEVLPNFEHELSFPCVVKKSDENQGRGVFLCETKQQLLDIFLRFEGSHLLIQKYIEAEFYLRVLVIGGEIVGAIERYVVDKSKKRQGIVKHSGAREYSLNMEEKELCIRALSLIKYDIAGIDLIYDKIAQKWNILEVNITPQFKRFMDTTKINVLAKIVEFLDKNLRNEMGGK